MIMTILFYSYLLVLFPFACYVPALTISLHKLKHKQINKNKKTQTYGNP